MDHQLIETLGAAPFDNLYAAFYENKTECFSFDAFRRLYNDAVKSMRFYRSVSADRGCTIESLEQRVGKLEQALHELTDS